MYELIFSAETAGNLPLTLTFVKGGGGVVNPMQWTKSPNSAEPVRLRLQDCFAIAHRNLLDLIRSREIEFNHL